MPIQTTRRLRHWKQVFSPKAKFVWSKNILYGGVRTEVGSDTPEALAKNVSKLRRFWESRVIQLKDFTPCALPKAESMKDVCGIKVPKGVKVKVLANNWYCVSSTERDESVKFYGKKKLNSAIQDMKKGIKG